jgi:hypothetical protein
MTPAHVDLTARNNADWTQAFVLYASPGVAPPWAAVETWASGVAYQSTSPASVVRDPTTGDLWVAAASVGGSWVSGATWAADAANWVNIGVASAYAGTPFSLVGATLKLTLAQTGGSGDTAVPRIVVIQLTSDGSDSSGQDALFIDDAINGAWHMNLPKTRAAKVPPGTYSYDVVASIGLTPSTTVTIPLLWGQFTVVEGATP